MPLDYERAEVVLKHMGGDWIKWRSLPRVYKARLIATQRVLRMKEAADGHDQMMRYHSQRREM